jgi:transposase
MGVSRMGRVSRWSREFREEAVRLHRESGESIAAVARRLGVGAETMRRWVRDAEVERGERDGVTVAEQAEIRELRRQVRRLEEEKLILQKAAAYFARETGQLP